METWLHQKTLKTTKTLKDSRGFIVLQTHFILASYYNKLVLLDISTVPPLGLGPLKRKKKENSATIQLSWAHADVVNKAYTSKVRNFNL